MSGCFEDSIHSYVNAILAVHSKYSSKRVHDKAAEIANDVITAVFESMMKLNPEVIETVNNLAVAPITDEVASAFKGKKKAPRRIGKTLNSYTSIFIPVIRKIAEPILLEWDEEDPDVNYNRITSINSIASKIYKNITDKNNYTDHYEYYPDETEGKTTGVIKATADNPEDFDKISKKYENIVKTLAADKETIDAELANISDDEIKSKKSELVAECMKEHEEIYDSIHDYVVSFMDNYRDALRNMCLDKPLKKAKKATKPKKTEKTTTEESAEEEGILMDEDNAKPFELAPVDDLLNDPIEEEIEIPAAPVPVPAAPSKSAKLPTTNPPPAVKKTTKKPSAKKTRKN